MQTRVVVRVEAGPQWNGGPIREQLGWDDHAVFIDELVARGVMVLGGPFADNSGSLMVFEGVDEADVRALVERDPFVLNGVFRIADIREWTVFVDRLSS